MKRCHNKRILNVSTTSISVQHERKETLHTYVMKCMFLAKRMRLDILTGVVFLSTRILKPITDGWEELLRILNYLNLKRDIMLKLEAEDITNLKWYVYSSFGMHTDFKSHTGSTFSLGKGSIWSDSNKQKVNAQSSTEAELIANLTTYTNDRRQVSVS